jgi:hypothetical protein
MKLITSLGNIEVGSFMIGEKDENIPNWGIFIPRRTQLY